MSLVRQARQQEATYEFKQQAANDCQESDDETVPDYWQDYENKYAEYSHQQLRAACDAVGLKVLIDMHLSSSHIYATIQMISYCSLPARRPLFVNDLKSMMKIPIPEWKTNRSMQRTPNNS
jgi:hypothetical protein